MSSVSSGPARAAEPEEAGLLQRCGQADGLVPFPFSLPASPQEFLFVGTSVSRMEHGGPDLQRLARKRIIEKLEHPHSIFTTELTRTGSRPPSGGPVDGLYRVGDRSLPGRRR